MYSVAALRDLLFAPLVGGDTDEMDLIAIDIQRERDVGLGTLNQTRRALGLSAYSSFSQVTPDPILQNDLQMVYGSVGNLDLFIGGPRGTPRRGSRCRTNLPGNHCQAVPGSPRRRPFLLVESGIRQTNEQLDLKYHVLSNTHTQEIPILQRFRQRYFWLLSSQPTANRQPQHNRLILMDAEAFHS